MKDFINSIISREYLDLSNDIITRLNLYTRRLEMQICFSNDKVLNDGDFVAHIVGEMNGFFNGIHLAGIITISINVQLGDNTLIFSNKNGLSFVKQLFDDAGKFDIGLMMSQLQRVQETISVDQIMDYYQTRSIPDSEKSSLKKLCSELKDFSKQYDWDGIPGGKITKREDK